MKYNKHIFICINERADCSRKGDCARAGGKDIRMKFVQLINANGLKGKVRANKSGCLDACEMGAAIVIYPSGIWYTNVKVKDVEEIFETSVLDNRIVNRLVASTATWKAIEEIRQSNKVNT